MSENGFARIHRIPIEKLSGYEGARPPAALVRSMVEQGFLVEFPIVVTPLADGCYQILDGRRRTAAAEKAGLEAVLAVVKDLGQNRPTEMGAALTILAHATRGENPVAELKAYQALMRAGMSEQEIARAGYATVQRVHKVGKLNNLIPRLAERVEAGEIAPGVAFQIAALAPEVQAELAGEVQVTGPVVKAYRATQRRGVLLGTPDLTDVFEIPSPATIEEIFEALSTGTLEAILAELPEEERFTIWRGKLRRVLLSEAAFLPLEIRLETAT